MFIAALFTIWKQPRCPSADEWIRKLWYIYTMEYYSAIKKNTFESVLMRWMKLESGERCHSGEEARNLAMTSSLCDPFLLQKEIEATAESAFTISPYLVILSSENHVD